MNKGDAQPGVHVQNTQITQKTAVHEQNADFAFRTAPLTDVRAAPLCDKCLRCAHHFADVDYH